MKYLERIDLIASDCHLRSDEEELLLERADASKIEVKNRKTVLKAMKSTGAIPPDLEVAYPSVTDSPPSFDAVMDKSSIHESNVMLAAGKLTVTSYKPPSAETGTGCIKFLDTIIENNSFSLAGILTALTSSSHNSFILCYELLCGHLSLKILEQDDPKTLGYFLAHFIPFAQGTMDKFLLGILRVAMFNPNVAQSLPGYNEELLKAQGKAENEKSPPSNFFVQVVDVLKGQVDFAKQNAQFLLQVSQAISKSDKSGSLVWPTLQAPDKPPRIIPFVQNSLKSLNIKAYLLFLGMVSPEKIQITCSRRSFRPTQRKQGDHDKLILDEKCVVELTTLPMVPFGLDAWIANLRVLDKAAEIPLAKGNDAITRFFEKFHIEGSSICRSRLARESIDRVARDWDFSSRSEEKQIANELTGFTKTDIQALARTPSALAKASRKILSLHSALVEFQQKDFAESQEIIDEFFTTLGQAKQSDFHQSAFKLAHGSGLAPSLSFEYFASLLLDDAWDARISEINPFLDSDTIGRCESLLVSALLKLSRVGLVSRCIAAATEMLYSLEQASSSSEAERAAAFNAISLKAGAIAEMLSTRRSYAQVSKRDRVHVEYDPRFLLFEFSANIILRDAQIRLVKKFVDAVEKGESLCHQLIMGAGKTTVIAPLLALILGSPKRLVVQVMHLAPFTVK